ncbi:hypothetical protein MHYP_G00293080 [Metynnis hypsauchen]
MCSNERSHQNHHKASPSIRSLMDKEKDRQKRIKKDVCPITANMEGDALKPGTVSAALVMGRVTVELPVTHENKELDVKHVAAVSVKQQHVDGGPLWAAVYEQSCEAYKHLGRSSDLYWIDPDGSGPLGPFKVLCNMTEDKVWTTVVNNLPAQTSVTGSSRERRTVLQLNYSATMEQINAITSSAEHCEQHVAYSCRMSRLLNTPAAIPWRSSSLLSDYGSNTNLQCATVGQGADANLLMGMQGPAPLFLLLIWLWRILLPLAIKALLPLDLSVCTYSSY